MSSVLEQIEKERLTKVISVQDTINACHAPLLNFFSLIETLLAEHVHRNNATLLCFLGRYTNTVTLHFFYLFPAAQGLLENTTGRCFAVAGIPQSLHGNNDCQGILLNASSKKIMWRKDKKGISFSPLL